MENKKPIEEVRYWDYEIKTSKLSPSARSKIIKKYGGDYVSAYYNSTSTVLEAGLPTSLRKKKEWIYDKICKKYSEIKNWYNGKK